MDQLAAEEARKERSKQFFRAREADIEAVFANYRSEMERELEDCVNYVQVPETMQAFRVRKWERSLKRVSCTCL